MAIARAEGEPVAAQFWTVEGGTAFIHKLAHTEASKPLSPGTTLSAALFEQVIDRDGVIRAKHVGPISPEIFATKFASFLK
jgi:hypothetical protein